MHKEILPRLPIPSLHQYGLFPEQARKFCWMFIEDAGNECYLPDLNDHGVLGAALLAPMQMAAAALVAEIPLAERAPVTYSDASRAAREPIRLLLKETDLSDDERLTLAEISAHCDYLAACWKTIEALNDAYPTTLVHGNCHPANLRMINTEKGPRLVLLDWDTTGIASPAANLALIGLHRPAYWSAV